MINKLSKELSERNIYHKIEKNLVKTRRTITKIPFLNKDIAYLIGVIAGDGSMVKSKRKRGGFHYCIRIYAEEEDYLELLNEIIYKQFSIKGRINKDKRKRSAYHLIIQNAPIFFYFVTSGNEIGKKKRFNIPEIIKEDKKYFLEYLAGITDTDGHVCGKRIQLKQKSENLLKEICKISNKLGLNCAEPKVNYTNNVPYYYIRFDNRIPLRFKTNNFLNKKK